MRLLRLMFVAGLTLLLVETLTGCASKDDGSADGTGPTAFTYDATLEPRVTFMPIGVSPTMICIWR
jgi:hypothetical protein